MTRSNIKVWTTLVTLSFLNSILGSPAPGSYDPEPLTPFNGLKLQRSPLFQNGASRNTFYDDGGGGDTKGSADGSQGAFWPFSTPRPTVIGYAAEEPRSTPRPFAINVTPRSYASDSALFRPRLPSSNQPTYRPTTYQAGTGFPLLNSPNGVSYGDGRPTAVPPAARAYGVESLPPDFYFISPQNTNNHPPARFQEPATNYPVQLIQPARNGIRRIPEGLRRTQYYPSDDQPLSPLVRSGVTPYSVAPEHPPINPPATDTYETFHSFYAPKYNNYIPITRYSHEAHPTNGQYNVEFETGNGIYQKETGYIKKIEVYNPRTRAYDVRDFNVKTGTVSWTSPEGIPFTLSYIADEKGFRPIGSHIPSDGSGAAAGAIAPAVTVSPNYSYSDPVIPPNPLYHNRRAGY